MTSYVLDASVAAKWFLPRVSEPLFEEASELLREYAAGRTTLLVPELFWAEFGNIMWKAARLNRISGAAGERAVSAVRELSFPSTAASVLLESSYSIAISFDLTVYDAMYVALAVQRNAPLVTADHRLAQTVAAHFPVRWLGSL